MKKCLKYLLSCVIVGMLMLAVMPFTALAADSYTTVDYSNFIYVNYDSVETYRDATDPVISEEIYENTFISGAAKGYTAYLYADITHNVHFYIESSNASFINYSVAIVNYEIGGGTSLVDDMIAYRNSSANGTSLEVDFDFIPEENGFYKILVWGICEDASENDITGDTDTYAFIDVTSPIGYANVDYSYDICPDRTFNDFVAESAPYIYEADWYGFAQGYNLFLVGGKEYEIYSTLSGNSATYTDYAIGVLRNDFSGDISVDGLVVSTDNFGTTETTATVTFTPETTGYYKILTWGNCNDDANNLIIGSVDTAISIHVSTTDGLSYDDLDYSQKLTVGEAYDDCFDFATPYVYDYYNGYANGYNVDLEADKLYVIEHTVSGLTEDTYYTQSIIAILDDSNNIIEINNNARYSDSTTSKFLISVSETGNYKLVGLGCVEDSSYDNILGKDNTKATIIVREAVEADFDIYSAADLQNFREAVENAGADVYNLNFCADIDMSAEEWVAPELYNGNIVNIEGNNYVITGMKTQFLAGVNSLYVNDLGIEIDIDFDDESSDFEYQAVFAGWCDYAELYNCHAIGEINVNAAYIETIGGLVGDVYEGSIKHCSSSVNISINSVDEAWYVGGLAAYANFCEVYNSYYTGDIKVNGVYGVGNIGGLMGYAYDSSFENCYAQGSIDATDTQNSPADYYTNDIGGFIGDAENVDFLNCYAEVEVTSAHGGNVGGFVGSTEYSVYKNCYSEGNVNGYVCVGGFAGESYSGANTLFNCYTISDVSGYDIIGGFFGFLETEDAFYNCYTVGKLSTTNDSALIGKFYASISSSMDYSPFFIVCYVNEDNTSTPIAGETNYFNDINGDYTDVDCSGILSVDFSDEAKSDEVAAKFDGNSKALEDGFGITDLLKWTGRHDCGSPIFVYEKIEAPIKPCFHTYSDYANKYNDDVHWFECINENCQTKKDSIKGEEAHEWEQINDSCTDSTYVYECMYCDATYSKAGNGNHSFDEWTTIQEPSCTKEGKEVHTCYDCGHTESRDIPTTSHNDDDNDGLCDACGYDMSKPDANFMLGDVNFNDKIDMTDYILLKRAYFGTYTFDDDQNKRGDINKNGKIDMTDYILLKRAYFGTFNLAK